MKEYVLIHNDRVHEIIPEFDPNFPGVPIEQRYSPEFLKNCLHIDEKDIPPIGHVKKGNKFEEPPKPEPVKVDWLKRKTELLQELADVERKIAEEK